RSGCCCRWFAYSCFLLVAADPVLEHLGDPFGLVEGQHLQVFDLVLQARAGRRQADLGQRVEFGEDARQGGLRRLVRGGRQQVRVVGDQRRLGVGGGERGGVLRLGFVLARAQGADRRTHAEQQDQQADQSGQAQLAPLQ